MVITTQTLNLEVCLAIITITPLNLEVYSEIPATLEATLEVYLEIIPIHKLVNLAETLEGCLVTQALKTISLEGYLGTIPILNLEDYLVITLNRANQGLETIPNQEVCLETLKIMPSLMPKGLVKGLAKGLVTTYYSPTETKVCTLRR